MPKQVNVLLVEDDEVDIMNVQRAFQKAQIRHTLSIARNGMQALSILKNGSPAEVPPPRVILLDLNMPGMNGIEFLKEVRHHPELKSLMIFVMTTSNEESDKISAYNFNAAGYILKPLSSEGFVQIIKTLDEYWQICEIR